MVKNTTGGSKAKGQARKVGGGGGQTHRLHISHDELEVYAVAVRAYGNAMFEVLCCDNVKRLCHIRGKFKGRGKRDNFISVGTYLLVGLREWESQDALIGKNKLPNCDLIVVYSDQDKDRLRTDESHIDWDVLKTMADSQKVVKDVTDVDFTQDEAPLVSVKGIFATDADIICDDEEAINVDDI
jgi:translation initiation factor IF-1